MKHVIVTKRCQYIITTTPFDMEGNPLKPPAYYEAQLQAVGLDRNGLELLEQQLVAAISRLGPSTNDATARHVYSEYLMLLGRIRLLSQDGTAATRLQQPQLPSTRPDATIWCDDDFKPLSQVLRKRKRRSSGAPVEDVVGEEERENEEIMGEQEENIDDDDEIPLMEDECGNIKTELTALLIQAQIRKATEQLDAAPLENHPALKALPPDDQASLVDGIRQAINNNNVKPLFHALSLPPEFLDNSISISKVMAGDFDEEKHVVLEKHGENLSGVVKNGIGARFVRDTTMKEDWVANKQIVSFAVEGNPNSTNG